MIYTISGSNGFMVDERKRQLINDYIGKYGDFAVEQFNCDEVELQVMLDSLYALAFLTPAKLVVLHNPSANKQFVADFETILARVPDSTTVLIIDPAVDKRSVFFKQLKKRTEFENYDELDMPKLTKWLTEATTAKGGEIDTPTAGYLIERAGINQLRLNNELAKLLSYERKVTRKSIDLLVEPLPQTTIFQLLDSVFSGRKSDLLRIFEDQRRQRVEPQQILAILTWQVHILALIKSAGDKTPGEIAAQAKISPYVVGKSLNIARKLNLSDIKSITKRLVELDVKIKSKTLDADEALLQVMLAVAG